MQPVGMCRQPGPRLASIRRVSTVKSASAFLAVSALLDGVAELLQPQPVYADVAAEDEPLTSAFLHSMQLRIEMTIPCSESIKEAMLDNLRNAPVRSHELSTGRVCHLCDVDPQPHVLYRE